MSWTCWKGNVPLIRRVLDSSQLISVEVRLGAELSPLNSASGRNYLAHLPDKRRKELIDQHYENSKSLPKHRGKPVTRDELQLHLDTIKRDKYCAFFSDYLPEINVLSCPVFDINGSIVTVITLLGLDRDTDISEGSFLFEKVLECSKRVTRQICGQQREGNGRA